MRILSTEPHRSAARQLFVGTWPSCARLAGDVMRPAFLPLAMLGSFLTSGSQAEVPPPTEEPPIEWFSSLEIEVVDETGTPIPDAEVALYPLERGSIEPHELSVIAS